VSPKNVHLLYFLNNSINSWPILVIFGVLNPEKIWYNNNNNNNNQRQCLWCYPHDHGHFESSPGSLDECRLSAGWPPTLRPSQPTWAVSPPISGCYDPHPSSPFVIITQPESWYSFCRPMEGGRLSRPRHCRKGAQPVPTAVHRSGWRDKHNWPGPLTLQSIMPLLNHCDLLRHVGLNNLPKVVTWQRRGRELNSQPASCKSNALATRLVHLPTSPYTVTTLLWELKKVIFQQYYS